jgi:septum site-determining protein MinD
MGRVYAVVSSKGGVGKTTTAANLAAALAAAGPRVAIVDGDLGMANLAGALGVEVGEVTIHDVLAGDDGAPDDAADGPDIDAAIHEGPHGLAVVPGSPALDAFSRADPERLESVLDDLAAAYDYVILDTGAGLSTDTVAPLTFVDEILLVSTPTRDALGDTDKSRQVAERLGVTVAGAALLRADPAAAESDAVVDSLDVGVLGTVPDAEAIRRASEAGEPLTRFAPGSPAAAAFASLAAALTGEHVAAPTPDDGDAAPDAAVAPAAGDADDADGAATAASGVDPVESSDDGSGSTGDDDESGSTGDDDEDPDAGDVSPEAAPDAGEVDDDSDGAPAAANESTIDDTDDDEADTAADRSPDEAVPAETAASEPTSDPDPESAADVIDDAPESPVEPVDPAAVTAGEQTDDEGVYTTPLEEVPIEEAESGDAPDPGPTSATAPTPDAADRTADDDAFDSEDDEDDEDGGGGGFFSRFFG